jgi:hypothetical protein
MLLQLESHRDLANATPSQVARAISGLTSPTGPTYIILETEGSYCQAAGTNGRYVLESREMFGEGFTHFRACRGQPGSGEPTTVFHRKRCSKHQPRKCPLQVLSSEVVGFDDVRQALLVFATTGRRCPATAWRDVTEEFLKDSRGDEVCDDEIGLIHPSGCGGK